MNVQIMETIGLSVTRKLQFECKGQKNKYHKAKSISRMAIVFMFTLSKSTSCGKVQYSNEQIDRNI